MLIYESTKRILLMLVLYNCVSMMFFAPTKDKGENEKDEKSKKKMTYSAKLNLISCIILIIIYITIAFKNIDHFSAIFFPGFFLVMLSIFVAMKTVGQVVTSSDNTQLSYDEKNSIILFSLCFLLATPLLSQKMANYNATALSTPSVLIYYFFQIIFNTIYLFSFCAMSVGPLTDISRGFIWLDKRISVRFVKGMRKLWNKVASNDIRQAYSERIICKFQTTFHPVHIFWSLYYIFICFIDVFVYASGVLCKLILWLPFSCIVIIIMEIWAFLLKVANTLSSLSNRRSAVISFRVATILAILIAVIGNRVSNGNTSATATEILEFISSVVIIPIAFEWLHEVIQKQN